MIKLGGDSISGWQRLASVILATTIGECPLLRFVLGKGPIVSVCLILHFDGSCYPNPGGRASYGWHIDVEHAGSSTDRLADGHGAVTDNPTSNNIAEWRGLEAGLRWLSCWRSPVEHLTIVGDSQLVLNQLRGDWRCKKAHLGKLRDTCQKILSEAGWEWTATWVPREQNAEADALAAIG